MDDLKNMIKTYRFDSSGRLDVFELFKSASDEKMKWASIVVDKQIEIHEALQSIIDNTDGNRTINKRAKTYELAVSESIKLIGDYILNNMKTDNIDAFEKRRDKLDRGVEAAKSTVKPIDNLIQDYQDWKEKGAEDG